MRLRIKFLRLLAIAMLLAHLLILATAFYTAFFNGYQITIYINKMHEAWIEFFTIPLVAVLGFWLLCNELKNGNMKKKNI